MVRIVVKGNAQWSGGSSLSSLYRVTPLLTTRSSQCPLVGTETACFVRFPCDLMVFTGTTKKSENNCAFSTAFGFLRSISLVELFQILELPWLMWSVAGTSFLSNSKVNELARFARLQPHWVGSPRTQSESTRNRSQGPQNSASCCRRANSLPLYFSLSTRINYYVVDSCRWRAATMEHA